MVRSPPATSLPAGNRKAAFPVKSPMITSFSSLLLPPWAEERVTDIQFYFVVLIDIFYYGHTFGVRVLRVQKVQKVQRVQRVVVAADAIGHACGVRVHRVQKVQRVQRVVDCPHGQ